MKIEIEYYKNQYGGTDFPCGARTYSTGELVVGCGKTWEEAKEAVLYKIQALNNLVVPQRETVEIGPMLEAVHDMQQPNREVA